MNEFSTRLRDLLWKFKENKRAQLIAAIALGGVLITVVGYLVIKQYQPSTIANPANNNTIVSNTNVTELAPRRIDGVLVPAFESNLLPIEIMLENLVSVRPQSGLGGANLVYEALAEGGITRFLAIYAKADKIEPIGPVRSARHYYVDMAEEYHGLFAHVGGSPQALGVLGSTDYLTDLNQFGYSSYYYRAANVPAPHNLFTSSDLMLFALRDLGLDKKTGDYAVYQFKKDSPTKTSAVKSIKINFSSADYEVEWRYQPDSNSYLRWNGGVEHVDANTKKQLEAKTIVVQFTNTTVLESTSGRLDMTTIGDGKALLFQDGVTTEGTWKKVTRGERTKFYDTNDKEMQFNTGTTWIEIVPSVSSSKVTY